jgi:hypothetical protein
MSRRAEVLALAIASASAACGGLVEGEAVTITVPPRATEATDDSCVLREEEVLGFAVDEVAIWRVQRDCRPGKGGSVVVREDRATGARAIAAERVWGSVPVLLAGDAIVLRDTDRLRRVSTKAGASDEITIRPQHLASDGDAAYATISGGTAESRYAVLRIGPSGDPETVGGVPAVFQMQALAASKGQAFATLWSVCDGASSCAGLYSVGPAGTTKLAAWPVTDLGVAIGPLAVRGDRAVTSAGAAIVEAAGGAVRTLASIDVGASVVSIALGDGGKTFACLAPVDKEGAQRVVEVKDGALVELASGACGTLTWSAGELFWEQPEKRQRYGVTLVVSTIGRRRTD